MVSPFPSVFFFLSLSLTAATRSILALSVKVTRHLETYLLSYINNLQQITHNFNAATIRRRKKAYICI